MANGEDLKGHEAIFSINLDNEASDCTAANHVSGVFHYLHSGGLDSTNAFHEIMATLEGNISEPIGDSNVEERSKCFSISTVGLPQRNSMSNASLLQHMVSSHHLVRRYLMRDETARPTWLG